MADSLSALSTSESGGGLEWFHLGRLVGCWALRLVKRWNMGVTDDVGDLRGGGEEQKEKFASRNFGPFVVGAHRHGMVYPADSALYAGVVEAPVICGLLAF